MRLPDLGRASVPLLALALALAACDLSPEPSDAGQYQLEIGLENPLGSHARLALVGSSFDLRVKGLPGDDGEPVSASCIAMSPSGVISQTDDDQFLVAAVGPGAVELAPDGSCPDDAAFAELEPDRWSMTGVAADDVVGRWAHPDDASIRDFAVSPGPRGEFPDVIDRPIDELLVVADHLFAASPALVLAADADEPEVRWAGGHELELPGHYWDLQPASETDEDGRADRLLGALHTGESFTASLTLLGTTHPLPPARAVPIESLASLELVPVYWPGGEEREWGPPVAVRAITRDGDGRRVLGAPVEFELTRGALALEVDRDTLLLDDICRAEPRRPTAHSATVHARVAALEADVELEWVTLPGEAAHLFEDDANCEGPTCACTSARGPTEPGAALLALFGLGAWLRRRR